MRSRFPPRSTSRRDDHSETLPAAATAIVDDSSANRLMTSVSPDCG
jgi:hypothetical protein